MARTSGAPTHVQEYRFDVDESWHCPEAVSTPPPGGRVRVTSSEAEVTYLDTPDQRLRRLHVSFERRRTDDEPSVWRLSLPHGAAQAGVQLHAGDTDLPEPVLRQLGGILTGTQLIELATVHTSTRRHQILDRDDQPVAEVADQTHRGVALGTAARDGHPETGSAATTDSWRHVTLSRGPYGDDHTFRTLRQGLKRSGARRNHDLDDGEALDRLRGPLPDQDDPGDLTSAVGRYISDQCSTVLLHDVSLREHGDTTAVHQMRVALRRLRSVLRGFAIDPGQPPADGATDRQGPAAAPLIDDLRWVATQLGAIRDLDVLQRRVKAGLAALPAGDLIGPVARHTTEILSVRRAQAYQDWQHAWDDDRYRSVMAALTSWQVRPPLTTAPRPAKRAVGRADRRLVRALDAASSDPSRWHDARKAAKRLRYVAEAAAVTKPSASKIARRAKKLQQALGDHHDAVATAEFLHAEGRAAGARADDNGFSYGLLVADQRQQADRILRHLPKRP